jgi:hypothetical protein
MITPEMDSAVSISDQISSKTRSLSNHSEIMNFEHMGSEADLSEL